VFLHLPRTAGTTMRIDILYQCVDPAAIFLVNGAEPPVRGGTIDKLVNLPRNELDRLQLIVGHMPFGVRERLPEPETWDYVTFLRDPIARTVSAYYQVRSTPDHLNHADALRYSLEEFVDRRCDVTTWNGMCRMLSNEAYGATFDSPEMMFQGALRHAEACSFVGLMESFDESVRRMCALCGWKVPAYGRRNSHTPKQRRQTDREIAVLRENNTFDQRLYDRFRECFEREHTPSLAMRVLRKLFGRRVA
jgi:hypothetical protein